MTSGNVVANSSIASNLVLASELYSISNLEDPGLVLIVFGGVDNPWRISTAKISENSEKSKEAHCWTTDGLSPFIKVRIFARSVLIFAP